MSDVAKAAEPVAARAPVAELESQRAKPREVVTAARELATLPTPVETAGQQPPPDTAPGTLLVETNAGPGQWTKREFLERVRRDITQAAEQELAGTGWTVDHCPYFEYWFSYYERRSAADIEAALYKYAPDAAIATSAESYVDPLVSRLHRAVIRWRATGEVDAPPAVIPKEVVTQAQLGAGRPLDSTTRTRMEQAMDTSLAGIRLHDDAVAARVVSSQQARALALGSHVAFASGQYQPGTVRGDALLAHELAHTQQQQGTAAVAAGAPDAVLERAADRHAMSIFGRLRLGLANLISAPPGPSAGLRLQRCRTAIPEEQVPAQSADPVAAVPQTSATPTSTVDLSSIPTVDTSKYKQAASESLLFITGTRQGSSDRELFILPATGFVLEAPAPDAPAIVDQPPPAHTNAPAPASPTVLAMPAAGHAGVHLINTGNGTGILLDVAGTANGKGTPDILVSQGLLRLQAEMGIERVDGAFISHAHADHAGALEWVVQNGNLTGNKVWVMPGLEDLKNGPLGKGLMKLGEGGVSKEFQKGWKATPLATQKLNATVTTGTLEVGTATLRMAVRTADLEKFVTAATTGNWSQAKGLADAATPLVHVSWKDTSVEALIVGDLRGATINKLAANMGDAEFAKFVGNARIVIGLHHLGAIKSPTDVAGLQKLIGALGGGTEPIAVLAQVGPEHEVNDALVKALQIAGAQVIFVDKPDPGKPNAGIKALSPGKIDAQGATIADIDPTTKDVQDRIETLERAQRTLEVLPDFRGITDVSKQDLIDGLKTQAQRLREGMAKRQILATQDLNANKPTQDTLDKLEANASEIKAVQGMELHAADDLSELALSPEDFNFLVKELARAESSGMTSLKLRQLLARVDPQSAKDILMKETTGEPESREAAEEMWERIGSQLEIQAETEEALQIQHFPGATSRAAAWVGLALEAFEIVKPALEQWAKSRDDVEHEDFYMFFRDLMWWNEKGIRPAAQWSPPVTKLSDVQNSVTRRLYDDAPSDKRGDVPAKLENVVPMKRLWIPWLAQWTQADRAQFFHALRLWMDLHVRSVDDYFREIKTGISAPIRPVDKDHVNVNGKWELHVGSISDDHVQSGWQPSEDLTTIMQATMARAETNTKSEIDERVKAIGTQPKPSSVATAGPSAGPAPTAADSVAVGRLRVTAEKAYVFTLVNGEAQSLDRYLSSDGGFRLLELSAGAPTGFVWVAPGDAGTALTLGAVIGLQQRGKVAIPKVRTDNTTRLPEEQYMRPDELAAWKAYKAGVPGYYFSEHEYLESRGDVLIYGKGPMRGGVVLMRRSDLGPDS